RRDAREARRVLEPPRPHHLELGEVARRAAREARVAVRDADAHHEGALAVDRGVAVAGGIAVVAAEQVADAAEVPRVEHGPRRVELDQAVRPARAAAGEAAARRAEVALAGV